MGLIFTISPIITLILARIFGKEPLTWRRMAGILLCILGAMFLLSRGQWQVIMRVEFNPGDLVAIAGSSLFAVYTFMLQRQPAGIALPFFLLIMFVCGFVGLIPLSLWEILVSDSMVFNLTTVSLLLYSGIGVSVIAYLGWNMAVACIGPVRTMILYYFCPLLTAAAAVIILNESITRPLVIGSGLIMGGVAIATLHNNRQRIGYSRPKR
jgi:drug/metabolite transporter (DMT)-like permease